MASEQIRLGHVTAEDLLAALNRVVYIIAKDETRQAFNSLYLELKSKNQKLRITATDGRRLSTLVVDTYGVDEDKQIIIPRKDVLLLRKKLKEHCKTISSCPEMLPERLLRLSLANKSLIVGIVDETAAKDFLSLRSLNLQYPPYAKIYEAHKESAKFKQIFINRKEWLEDLKSFSVFYDLRKDEICQVTLKLTKNNIRLIAANKQGNKGFKDYKDDYAGENFCIEFDIRYMLDFLKSVRSTIIKLSMTTEYEGIFLRPAGKIFEIEQKMSGIIMPIRL
jgi:DNA polymerase III sliding clamp (beta) subunit (PCNA family)